MQPSKGQRGSDRGYGPEYGVAMPGLRLFRGWQDKDRHDEAIRDAESTFRFPGLGPRGGGSGGGDHRNDRRSQVALSFWGWSLVPANQGLPTCQERRRHDLARPRLLSTDVQFANGPPSQPAVAAMSH